MSGNLLMEISAGDLGLCYLLQWFPNLIPFVWIYSEDSSGNKEFYGTRDMGRPCQQKLDISIVLFQERLDYSVTRKNLLHLSETSKPYYGVPNPNNWCSWKLEHKNWIILPHNPHAVTSDEEEAKSLRAYTLGTYITTFV